MSVDVTYTVHNVIIPAVVMPMCAQALRTELPALLEANPRGQSVLPGLPKMLGASDETVVSTVLGALAQFKSVPWLSGDSEITRFTGESTWLEDVVFHVIAPYVQSGGFIDAVFYHGESYTRYLFLGGKVHACKGRVEYEMPTEANLLVPNA